MNDDIFINLDRWRTERGLQNTQGNIAANISEELTELLRSESIEDEIDALGDCIVFSINAIEAKGYDAKLVLLEIYKEISSRTGEYNIETGKWEKYTTDEAKALWYKANFSLAKKDNK